MSPTLAEWRAWMQGEKVPGLPSPEAKPQPWDPMSNPEGDEGTWRTEAPEGLVEVKAEVPFAWSGDRGKESWRGKAELTMVRYGEYVGPGPRLDRVYLEPSSPGIGLVRAGAIEVRSILDVECLFSQEMFLAVEEGKATFPVLGLLKQALREHVPALGVEVMMWRRSETKREPLLWTIRLYDTSVFRYDWEREPARNLATLHVQFTGQVKLWAKDGNLTARELGFLPPLAKPTPSPSTTSLELEALELGPPTPPFKPPKF